jgi:hypothetical protein
LKTLAVVCALAAVAAADDTPTLKLQRQPPRMKMRPKSTAAAPAPAAKPTPMPAAPTASALAPDTGEDAAYQRDVTKPISLRVNLGYVVDGATLSGQPTLGGRTPVADTDFATLRSYGFGEAYFSSRGVVLQSLSSYFAMRFQATSELRVPSLENAAFSQVMAPPIATWFDRSGVDIRTGWAEVKDFLPAKLGLQELRVRAGDLYVYGPWVLHMFGGLVGWDGKVFSGTAYIGSRVPDYTLALSEDRPVLAGTSLRADLRGLSTSLPIALGAEALLFATSRYTQPSRHFQLEADWRPTAYRDTALIGQWRFIDDQPANEHVQLRSRYRQVTNVVLDVVHRHAADWRWDPSFVEADTDPTSARRYLELGPVLPQLVASLRGGTVLYDNLDLLARTAIAADLSDSHTFKSNFSPSYAEFGGAAEVRLRRTVAVGASILQRTLQRSDFTSDRIPDLAGPQGLPATNAIGEKSFFEVGLNAKMTLGARKFSAMVEAYARRTHYAEDYCLANDLHACVTFGPDVPRADLRGGGRFTVDAWVGGNLRLFASYELSSAIDFQPEISGFKSLKLMMEGVL